MEKPKTGCVRPLGCLVQVLGIPIGFVVGLFWGLVAPLASIAGMLLGVRVLTGKMPFPVPTEGEEAERQFSLRLVSTDDAKRFFAEQRDKAGSEIKRMRDEIQAAAQRAKSPTS